MPSITIKQAIALLFDHPITFAGDRCQPFPVEDTHPGTTVADQPYPLQSRGN